VKGIELPINILVIIAVAVIVLLGVIALYFSGFMGPAGIVTQDSAKSSACKIVMSNVSGCQTTDPTTIKLDGTYGVTKFDADKDGIPGGTGDSLEKLCENYFGVGTATSTLAQNESNCRRVCGCSG